MKAIEAHFATDNSPEAHDLLQRHAQKTRIKHNETIFLDRQREIHQKFQRVQYPGMTNMHTTVAFAVRGLRARPNMAPYVPLILTQSPETLKELDNILKLFQAIKKPRDGQLATVRQAAPYHVQNRTTTPKSTNSQSIT